MTGLAQRDRASRRLKAGDRVELRSPADILATLDEQGCLDGLPFMPEMLQFFGRPYTVKAQVERACDTISYTGVRRMPDTVLLDDLRCDGGGHAGCGTQCLLYWKEAWLRPVSHDGAPKESTDDDAFARLEELAAESIRGSTSTPDAPTFRCQATELVRASEGVGWYRVLGELTNGNVSLWRFIRISGRMIVEELGQRLRIFTYDPFRPRELAGRRSSQTAPRELQSGQLVRIRTKSEIASTLAQNGKNRGLWFDREMLPYCGQSARVKAKVERFIDEGTGKLIELGSDCYILDEVVCCGDRSENRWFCPRALYPWWRDCWLEPVEQEARGTS